MGQYDTAQVCLNGHCINDSAKKYPAHNKNYCDICGEKTITQCYECKTDIRGDYIADFAIIGGEHNYTPPNFCYNCGKPFPWLERKMKAAVEMVELEEILNAEEINNLKDYTKDITTDTPNAQVSAKRINILLRKIKTNSVPAIRALFVDIASETAKRIIMDTHPN